MTGFSLPVVLFVMSLGGALAAGGAFVTRQMAAGSRAMSRSAAIDGVGEEWVVRSVADLDPAHAHLPVGSRLELPPVTARDALAQRWVTRSDSSVYWIVVEVRTLSKPLLWRRLGVVLLRSDSGFALVDGRAWSDLH